MFMFVFVTRKNVAYSSKITLKNIMNHEYISDTLLSV